VKNPTMNRLFAALIALGTVSTLLGCPDKPPPPPPPTPKTETAATPPKPIEMPKPPPPPPLSAEDKQKALYGFGILLAQRTPVSQLGLSDAEFEEVLKGLKDSVGGKDLAVKAEEFGPKVDQLIAQRNEEKAAKAKAKGEEYLAKAAKEKGAEKLPSGIIFFDEKAGGHRHGEGELPRHPDRRHRVRLELQAQPAGRVPAQRRGQVLDRGRGAHEGRRQGQAGVPVGAGVRRARRAPEHSGQLDADLRGRAARDQGAARGEPRRAEHAEHAGRPPVRAAELS
jgi:hypothetical protein